MTYAEQVKAAVAARYGVPVLCEVQIIPRGVSGLVDEDFAFATRRRIAIQNHMRLQRLRAADPANPTQQQQRAESKARMDARRAQHRTTIKALMGRGLTMRQMAEESGLAVSFIHMWVKRIEAEA